jgi:outer membrane protein
MDMKISKAVLVLLLTTVLTTPVLAAEVIKLGFFDRQTIVDRTEMGKEGEKKFKAEMQKIRESLEGKRQEVEALQDEANKKKLIWSEEVAKAKLQELFAKKQELDRDVVQANRELDRLQQELLQPLKEKMIAVVDRIGKEEGYTMIFEGQVAGIVYAPSSLNLTDRIIREINENYASEKAKQ